MNRQQIPEENGKKAAATEAGPDSNALPQDYRDVSNQELFKNHVLCAQFLRNYSNCRLLANVQPEDIEDVSERFTSIMGTKVEGDTIKRIRLRDAPGGDGELYAVSLIEHKSTVDYDVVMQLLHYVSNIWRDYARNSRYQTEKGDWVEVNKAKAFRYPPVLPIVYYEGTDKWTAGMQLRDRVLTVEGLDADIPNFTYHLVGLRDYSNAQLLDRADEMSLIMLLNKIQTAEDLHEVLDLPADVIGRIVRNSPEHVRDIIRDVVYLLCRKVNMTPDETCEILSHLREGQNMGYMFENMEHMDIQEERRRTREARLELSQTKSELSQTQAKLGQAEVQLSQTQAELAVALEELERYRAAEREKEINQV